MYGRDKLDDGAALAADGAALAADDEVDMQKATVLSACCILLSSAWPLSKSKLGMQK